MKLDSLHYCQYPAGVIYNSNDQFSNCIKYASIDNCFGSAPTPLIFLQSWKSLTLFGTINELKVALRQQSFKCK